MTTEGNAMSTTDARHREPARTQVQPRPAPEVRPQPDAADRGAARRGALLRLGQPDLLGADGLGWDKVAAVVGAAGNALFANLPLLFAVGVAIGMAKKADGSTALAAVVGYLVFKGVGDADVAVRARAAAAGRGPGADQLRRARRHRHAG